MFRIISAAFIAAAAIALTGCERTETVSIGLDPSEFFIITQPEQSGGSGGVSNLDPAELGGTDLTDNIDKLDSLTMKSLRLEIVAVNDAAPMPNTGPFNQAGSLTSGTISLTDEVTHITHLYQIAPSLLPLSIEAGRTYDLGVTVPDPADASPVAIHTFLLDILKNTHVFSATASVGVDTPPVNITCKLHFDIDLKVTVKFP